MAKAIVSRKPSTVTNTTVDEAFGNIMRQNFAVIAEWEGLAYEGEDIEGVHQLRVVLRRMRSALSVFRKVIPREVTDVWGEEMRWAANELGPARDLDVFIDEGLSVMAGKFPFPEGEEKMIALAKKHRGEAYQRVRAMIDSERFKAFKKGFQVWLDTNGWYQDDLPSDVRHRMRRSVTDFAISMLSKRATTLMLAGEHHAEMTDTELHQLRIECKKMRYSTEFFTPLFDKDSMSVFTTHFRGVQGVLGTLNDVSVGAALLDRLLEGNNDRDLLRFAGAVVGWRARQYEEVKAKLEPFWNNLVNTSFPWLRASKKGR